MKNILETDAYTAGEGIELSVEKCISGDTGGLADYRADGSGAERYGRLFAVANSGASEPEHEACERAVGSLMEGFYGNSLSDRLPDRFRQAYSATSSLLYRIARESKGAKIMCSLTGLLLYQDKFYIMHVGNTKVFMLRNGKFIQLTKDQTVVGKMARLGLISPQEARVHPNRHVLLHYLGELPVIPADFYSGNILPGDFFFLTTPGLPEQVNESGLRTYFVENRGEQGCLRTLLTSRLPAKSREAAITIDTAREAEKGSNV